MTDPTTFEISRRNELYHDGEFIGRFATEHEAADMAVRFAQDEGLMPYTIVYGVTNPMMTDEEYETNLRVREK